MLQDSNINIDGIITDSSRKTIQKLRVIAGNQQLVRIDFEDTFPVSNKISDQIIVQVKDLIDKKEIDAIIFEDYNKGLLNKAMVQQIVDYANINHIYTSLDPHSGHSMEIQGFSLMTPNRVEAFGLANLYCSSPKTNVEEDEKLKEVANTILQNWKVNSLLITLGPQGMALFHKDKPVKIIPTKAKEVFDVSGAGDTVIAVYTVAVTAGANEEEAAQIANYAAGIVVGKFGTATTTVNEILESI